MMADDQRQLKFPAALTHENCYRAGGRCLTKMLPVKNGRNGRQIEGATERGKPKYVAIGKAENR